MGNIARIAMSPIMKNPIETQFQAPIDLKLAGTSPAWLRILKQVEIVAPNFQCAIVEGGSGVGKETLARYIHSRSPLRQERFLRYDAREFLLRETDTESLVGFVYLDRVDLLAAPGQGLLLAFLKSIRAKTSGTLAMLASSQTPLRTLTLQGRYLPDLAFHLSAIRFAIPPLRERREDIIPIAQAMLHQICSRYQQHPHSLSNCAINRLLQHQWPGNLRELQCVLESAILSTESGLIRTVDLSFAEDERRDAQPTMLAVDLLLETAIRRHVQYVLHLNRGNKLRAACQLGISRSTLYRVLGRKPVAIA